MPYLQERIVHYLTADPRLFVAEERLVSFGGDPDKDVWWIDALAVDPWSKMFFLGEATYNRTPKPLMQKLSKFGAMKTEVLKRLGRGGAPEGWDIRPWLFIRKDALEYVVARIPVGMFPRITFLEDTAFPWIYEPLRSKGLEPNRPYPGVDERYQL